MKSKAFCILILSSLVGMFVVGLTPQPVKVGASSAAGLLQTAGTDWWPMFHHDLNHSGTSTSTAPNTNQTLWKYRTGSGVESDPAVVDGVVYVGSTDDNVYALNASTGAFVWKHATSSAVFSPAVVNGVVYVGSDDYRVYALNATTGTQVWSHLTGGYVVSSPAVSGGFVFVGSTDHRVYALNAVAGASVWNYTTGDPVESSPAVANGTVFVGSDDGFVYAFGPSTRVPEFPSYLVLPVLVVATVASAFVLKKKRMNCARPKTVNRMTTFLKLSLACA